jgi:CDP-diacylglycerol--glycerol-3-phosphate 3-phosphatidyltransferase
MANLEARTWGGMPKARWPDLVILTRVLLAFGVLGLFSLPFPFAGAALALTVLVIGLDGLDGYLARRLRVASDRGAVLDIAGDRIVEHVFWIYYAVAGQVSVWVPVVIATRSFVVDTVRSLALSRGKTAFGVRTMQRSSLSRFLVGSRFMRGAYGVAKVGAFLLVGALIVLHKASVASIPMIPPAGMRVLETGAAAAVCVTMGLCLVRGLPVVWDAAECLGSDANEEDT